MHRYYEDILKRINEPPKWFDEFAVPRFDEFEPTACADIYAKQVVLARIACQNCHRPFDVCFSWARLDDSPNLESLVHSKSLAYGDPPNIRCCDCGPTMSSDTERVLQFWEHTNWEWRRRPELEIAIDDLMPDSA